MRLVPFFSLRLFFVLAAISLLFFNVAHAGTETLITVNTSQSNQQEPAIWGDWIIWEDTRTGGRDIFGYNLGTGEEKRISNSTLAHNPGIFGNTVVWQDSRNGNYDIYTYDLVTLSETIVASSPANEVAPAISNSYIVWQEKQGTKFDIILYNRNQGTTKNLTPDTMGSDQKFPAVDGDLVVWEDYRNGGSSDIFLYNVNLDSYYNLTPGTNANHQITPAISGTNVIWKDQRFNKTPVSRGNIYLNDTSTWITTEIDFPPASAQNVNRPAISNNKVVWLDSRDRSAYDLYLKDISSPDHEKRITSDAAKIVTINDQNIKMLGASINNNRIVWTDMRSGANSYDIYLYTDDITTTCPEADFSPSVQSSATIPLTVTFTDTSSNINDITHRRWEFGDGSTSTLRNPSFTYNSAGTYVVRLNVGNSACRNETPMANQYNISVGIPFVSFNTDTTSGIVPLDVQFTDISIGATQWNWTFGDGSVSGPITDPLVKNVIHTFPTPGTYTAILNASNSYGFATATKTIEVKSGAKMDSNPSISGIDLSSPHGLQLLTFDKDRFSSIQNTGTILICTDNSLANQGFQNITFLSDDGIGFHDDSGHSILGNVSKVILQSKKISPTGFSSSIGSQSSVTYSLTSPLYPVGGSINTQVWEGATSSDRTKFDYIASKSNFNSIAGLAYTTKITKSGFPSGTTVRLNVSVSKTWVDQLDTDHLYLIRLADDGSTGEVLQTRLVASDTTANLYYFEADSSRGASTFGLALLSGSGNPFQLITLTIASQVNAPSGDSPTGGTGSSTDSSNPGTGGSKGVAAQAPMKGAEQKAPPEFVDPGKTASLYTNANGVITQETSLKSTDALATVVLKEGTIAHDPTGTPLSSVSIASIPGDAIPAAPSGQAVMIDGRAYELGPDKATFSPGITVTFTIPQAQWGKEYSLMMHDRTTGTWSEIPGSFSAKDGTFTAVLSHFCCVALFEKEIGQPAVPRTTRVPQPEATRLAPVETPAPQPPQSALSIVFSMTEWITGEAAHRSSYLTAFAIIGVIVLSIMLLHRRRNNP